MSTTHRPPPTPRPDEEEAAPPRPLGFAESQEVVATAHALQEEAEARAESERRLREMTTAAEEVGLDPAHLPMAERLVRARVEERARREVEGRKRRVLGIGLFAAGLATVMAVGSWYVFATPAAAPSSSTVSITPVVPWTDAFSAGSWSLDVSTGSSASLSWPEQSGRGTVAEVRVERFAPMVDGRYWANLDSLAHPGWAGATEVTFAVQGEGLGNVRVYLETPDERWRGPLVPVTAEWASHTLRLDTFERQVRDGSGWRVVAYEPPERVVTTSFKVGWYVNEADATGYVRVDDLSAR